MRILDLARQAPSRAWRRKISPVVWAIVATALTLGVARGQLPSGTIDPDQRQREYEQLYRDVDALQRQLSIYKRVARLVIPSVVHIEATPVDARDATDDQEEAGSGIVVTWKNKNYILTNNHVIRDSHPTRIRIELADGRRLRPTRILSDPYSDVALMEVAEQKLTPARIGDSDTAEIGDIVMAFGSPFNLQRSVTRGIISAKGRTNLDLGDGSVRYQNFLQTDAAINPGNSGGPLVNLRGEVIGLNTAIASSSGGSEGIGFSIPANVAVDVMRQLIEHETVEGGFLGVKLDGNFDTRSARFVKLPRLMGTRIKQVTTKGPAEVAGMQVDDVIVMFDGVSIEDDDHLISLLKRTTVGRLAAVVLYRDSNVLELDVVVGRRAD